MGKGVSVYVTYRDDKVRVHRTYRNNKIYVYITYRDNVLVSLVIDISHNECKNNRRKSRVNIGVDNCDTFKQRNDI